MEGVMLTVALVLLLAVLLFAMGAVGALMVAGVRQIVDEIEIRESQRPDETAPEPGRQLSRRHRTPSLLTEVGVQGPASAPGLLLRAECS